MSGQTKGIKFMADGIEPIDSLPFDILPMDVLVC